MSFQAQNWAVAQVMKSRVKFVLVMLANHADPDTGHCWPSIECLMRETCCSRASIYSFLGALRRNGYISMRKSKHAGRSHDFWLHFDREEAPWIEAADNNPSDETQDVDASPGAGLPDDVEESKLRTPGIQTVDSSLYIDSEPSIIEPSARETAPSQEPQPQALVPTNQPKCIRDSKPSHFDPTARQAELARQQAAEEARSKRIIGVIEGSEPWKAWVAAGHKPRLVTTIVVNGRHDRGWYFQTLWPPKSTGPPPETLMTPYHEVLSKEF